MRRLLPVALLLFVAPFGSAPASACAPPADEPPRCCERLVDQDVLGHRVIVPNPTNDYCS
jgi:hypothetical protein